MDSKNTRMAALPVLFGFFIMGFVDVVGISASYVKKDFALSDTLSNLLPTLVFLWFAVFSIPTGMLMNKLGRKNTVLLSMALTIAALMIPLFAYRFAWVLIAFALLGIGNTLLQVALNPLVSNVVRPDRLTSSLTLGQFIKAISSFLGPVIAGATAYALGNWKLMFPVFALVTLLSTLWLLLTPIAEDPVKPATTSFGAAFRLLGDRTLLFLFLGILFVVGVDVGMNTATPKFLMEKTGMALEKAGWGTSIYFAARTAGALIGAILLAKYSARLFFKISMFVAIVALAIQLFLDQAFGIFVTVAVIGFAVANVFSILFSMALQRKPERANEISGLMVMGIAGGALMPPIMGLMADWMGQSGALLVILACMLYLLGASFWVKSR